MNLFSKWDMYLILCVLLIGGLAMLFTPLLSRPMENKKVVVTIDGELVFKTPLSDNPESNTLSSFSKSMVASILVA